MPIRVSQEDQAVTFPATTVSHPLVVDYFGSLPDAQRESAYQQAITIGVMALREERIAAFLARTESELGVQLEHLKHLFTRHQLRMGSAPVKGSAGEVAMADALSSWVEGRRLPDSVQLVRTSGTLPRNKTGDILCRVGEGDEAPTIVIECKLNKSIRLGDPSIDGMTAGKSDTAWSQLIEARANREADLAIMVFSADNADRTIMNFTDSVRYIDSVGFVVLVDMARSDFRPLSIAYELARQQVLARRRDSVDAEVMDTLVRRLCNDLSQAFAVKDHIESAKASCDSALAQIDVYLGAAAATQKALQSYLKSGRLESRQLLELLVPHKLPAAGGVSGK